jgi:hypothetical protein
LVERLRATPEQVFCRVLVTHPSRPEGGPGAEIADEPPELRPTVPAPKPVKDIEADPMEVVFYRVAVAVDEID